MYETSQFDDDVITIFSQPDLVNEIGLELTVIGSDRWWGTTGSQMITSSPDTQVMLHLLRFIPL